MCSRCKMNLDERARQQENIGAVPAKLRSHEFYIRHKRIHNLTSAAFLL